jgi:hypothetical protein
LLSFSQYIYEAMNKQKAIEFIKKAHAGQKYGSSPYWTHPKAVADAGKKFFGSKFDEKAYIAALLHDVIEDTPYKEKELKDLGFDDEILSAVKLLTKDKSMSYADNIVRIISSGDKRAMMVKYADNYVNFTGDKSGWDPEKKAASQAKYKKSITTIGSKLGVKTDLPENFASLAERCVKSLNTLGEALGVKSDWILEDSQLYEAAANYAKNSAVPYKVQVFLKNEPIGNPERAEDAFQKNDISVTNMKPVVDSLKKWTKATTYNNKGQFLTIKYV